MDRFILHTSHETVDPMLPVVSLQGGEGSKCSMRQTVEYTISFFSSNLVEWCSHWVWWVSTYLVLRMFCVLLLVTACGVCTVIYRLMDFQHNKGGNPWGLAEFVLHNSFFNFAPNSAVALYCWNILVTQCSLNVGETRSDNFFGSWQHLEWPHCRVFWLILTEEKNIYIQHCILECRPVVKQGLVYSVTCHDHPAETEEYFKFSTSPRLKPCVRM